MDDIKEKAVTQTLTASANISCREIDEDDTATVIKLLEVGFPERPVSTWHRAFARLRAHPTPAGYPKYGHLLEHDGLVVGVVLTIFTAGPVAGHETIRCNLSSWYVSPPYRAYASLLSARALRRREVMYLNITPHPSTIPILEAQGYIKYCNGAFFAIPGINSIASRAKIKAFTQPIGEFSAFENQLLFDHAEYGCISVVCQSKGHSYPFVFSTNRVCRAPAAYLTYCRSTDEFVRFSGPLGRYLAWRGHPIVIIDADGPIRGLIGIFYDQRPKYYKIFVQRGDTPLFKPRIGDLAYTERPMFGM